MSQKINSILSQALQQVEPSKEDLKLINDSLKDFKQKLESEIKKKNIKAQVFVGGSVAKGTLIKKNKYDADAFLRFDKKYQEENISDIAKKLLKNFKNVSTIHGSREYFKISITPGFYIELVPVIKVANPQQSQNITDLSYSHVNYIRKKIKSKKTLDEIRLAKAFCYAHHCYGAESYIQGFSGYALELLVYNYKSFLSFLKAMVKIKSKQVIDIEKHYKNKSQVLLDLNSSKLHSPIILIDPTYKQRNALAALSEETLKEFQKAANKFLKSPSIKQFELQKTDLKQIKKQAKKNKNQFIFLEAKTNKQEGDIAGSKLLKFYNHLAEELKKFFDIKNKGFNYNETKSAKYFFVAKPKKDILCSGPFIKDKKHARGFKNQHKKTFIKKSRIYAKEKAPNNLKTFILSWREKNSIRIKEMYILGLKVLE